MIRDYTTWERWALLFCARVCTCACVCVRVVILRMRVHPAFANKVWWRRVCVSWSVEVYWLEMKYLAGTVCFLAAVVAAKPPNIVFMLMDDVSYRKTRKNQCLAG